MMRPVHDGPRARRRSVPPRAGALLALALLVACSPSESTSLASGSEARLQRLELTPLDGAGRPAALKLVASLGVPEAPGDWVVSTTSFELARDGGAPVLRVEGPEARVTIPGKLDPGSFNRVAVHFTCPTVGEISIQLGRGRKPAVVGSLRKHLERSPQRHTLLFDFPVNFLIERPFDELTLSLFGLGKTLDLHGVDLLQVPLASWLPAPGGAGDVVLVGEDGRRAVGLAAGRPLECAFDVPEGGVLRFARGLPSELFVADAEPELVLTLLDGEEPVASERWALGLERSGQMPWRVTTVPLADHAGRRLRARFELETADGREAVCAIAEPALVVRGEGARTVLLVTSDTHRADYLGAAGLGVDVATPVLDAVAGRGVLFENCLSSTNVTNPSHIALMTATHPRDTGILNNFRPLAAAAPTLAERFAEAGWMTVASLSAHHLGHEGSGLGQGFDRLALPKANERDAESTIDSVNEWLPDAEGLPLFVWLHLFDAHTPYGPPEPWDRSYYPAGEDPFAEDLPLPDVDSRLLPTSMPGLRDLSFPEAQYRGEVSYLDDQLARLLDLPRFQSGLFAFTADHGESFGDHDVWWDHAGLYPQSIHVPLILAGPGVPAGGRRAEPVHQLDLGRTLLDLTGLGETAFPGRRLPLEGPADEGDGAPRFALAAHGFSASMTHGNWHLVLHLRRHFPDHKAIEFSEPVEKHRVELYDLESDPACENDLRVRKRRVTKMRAALVDWLLAAEDSGWASSVQENQEMIDQLRELGYVQADEDRSGVDWIDPECTCHWCIEYR